MSPLLFYILRSSLLPTQLAVRVVQAIRQPLHVCRIGQTNQAKTKQFLARSYRVHACDSIVRRSCRAVAKMRIGCTEKAIAVQEVQSQSLYKVHPRQPCQDDAAAAGTVRGQSWPAVKHHRAAEHSSAASTLQYPAKPLQLLLLWRQSCVLL